MFELIQVETSDHYLHQGLVMIPDLGTTKALLWVHGLTGNFYGSVCLLNQLAKSAQQQGMGIASFNNRGHDCISSIKTVESTQPTSYGHVNGGAGYENFVDSIADIQAGIDYLSQRGIQEILLVGHSTGANKVAYYQAVSQDQRVTAVVLSSPVSDRYGYPDQQQLIAKVKQMQELVKVGKGDELLLGEMYFPITPKRFLSLFVPGAEDQMLYGDIPPELPYVKQIKQPVLVLLGQNDEYLDRPIETVLGVFAQSFHSSKSKTLGLPLAGHSYVGFEFDYCQQLFKWILTL
jgi:pimeloyl-ACP methyl ester carboxylesterase